MSLISQISIGVSPCSGEGEIKLQVTKEQASKVYEALRSPTTDFYSCTLHDHSNDTLEGSDWFWSLADHRNSYFAGVVGTNEDGTFYIGAQGTFRHPDDLEGLDGTRPMPKMPCDEDILRAAEVIRGLLKLAG